MKSLLNVLAIFLFAFVNAHTVWVETELKGSTNKSHEIKIFFGEIEKPTPTAKWFSDIKDLEIQITAPSGKVFSTQEKKQSENYYSAFFVPTEKGTYTIRVKHLVKDVFRKMKITYQSTASVNVEDSEKTIKIGTQPLEYEVPNADFRLNKEQHIKAFLNGETVSKHKIKIVSDNGWEQNLSTNVNGEITFKPLWKGKYLVEFVNAQKIEGEHNGKPYETDYEMITYYIQVK